MLKVEMMDEFEKQERLGVQEFTMAAHPASPTGRMLVWGRKLARSLPGTR